MNEQTLMSNSEKTTERKLWFEGPNYTADAVVIDVEAAKLLLIKRGDTGEWALPGGFVDKTDTSPLDAAIREAQEEAGITIEANAPLIFRGIVDDPRNSETAWIETSAYLFSGNATESVTGSDDAQDAQWHDLNDLPLLYASHEAIVGRALEYLYNKALIETYTGADTQHIVDAGHMEYTKLLIENGTSPVFAKQHDPDRFTDEDRAARAYSYLEKEAFTMAHLRQQNFANIPERSLLHADALIMDAFREEDGWRWRAESDALDAYISDTLEALAALETQPLPADSFAIDPSYESIRTEGWQSFTDETIHQLEERLEQFAPRLNETAKQTAKELLADITILHHASLQPHEVPHFVFCHHDLRQSNLAWHPEHGTKLIDWSWAGVGEPKSDSTSFLIDIAKSGHDISAYRDYINPHRCLALIGFWLAHSTWPAHGDDTVRFQQFVSALSGYEVLKMIRE